MLGGPCIGTIGGEGGRDSCEYRHMPAVSYLHPAPFQHATRVLGGGVVDKRLMRPKIALAMSAFMSLPTILNYDTDEKDSRLDV